MKPYIIALTGITPENITHQELSKRIHRAASHLWQLKKCYEKIPPYCLRFKTVDVPEMIVRLTHEVSDLKAKRKELKGKQWFPKRSTANKVKTRIMRQAIREGYNAKEISGYFRISVQNVYARVGDIKTLKKSLNCKDKIGRL